MFRSSVWCPACKQWSAYDCVSVGDKIQCGNPSCYVKGVVTAGQAGLFLWRSAGASPAVMAVIHES